MDIWVQLKAWLFAALIAVPIVGLLLLSVAAARRARPAFTTNRHPPKDNGTRY